VQLRAQLDDAVAGECPFCGELMIKEIGQAFIGSEDSDMNFGLNSTAIELFALSSSTIQL
jgi:hypothetical protein